VAVGDGSRTVFSGALSENDVEPGTAQFTTAGFSLVDQGDGTLTGSGVSGSINYATGSWSIDFGGFAPDNGSRIICSYAYNLTTQATPATGSGSGSTGFELFSFTVNQTGEQLVLTDNTGRSYKGRMGSIRSTGGIDQDVDVSGETGAVAAVGDQVIGQFQASGVSPAGYEVKMTGVFQGVVGDGNQLAQRIMTGTWTEAGGRSGDINGAASPIAINANIAN
jgi:hypothetical protein